MTAAQTVPANDPPYRFSELGEVSERDRLLAASIANQQRAGFDNLLDIREHNCPDCNAPGFNSGWGVIDFTCGSSWLAGDDSECAIPCGPK